MINILNKHLKEIINGENNYLFSFDFQQANIYFNQPGRGE